MNFLILIFNISIFFIPILIFLNSLECHLVHEESVLTGNV